MNRLLIYLVTLLMLMPFILMVVYPESLDIVYDFFKQGKRFTYLIASSIFVFNVTNFYQLIAEAKLRNIAPKHINIVKIAMSLNVVLPTVVFLQFMRVDLAQEILMASVFYSLSVYYGVTRVSSDKT